MWCRFLLLMLVLAGCSKPVVENESTSGPQLVRQIRDQGLIVIYSLSETNISTIGSVTLILEIHAEQEEEIYFPNVRDRIEGLLVMDDVQEPAEPLANGKIRNRRSWQLAPESAGTLLIPELIISGNRKQIRTPPMTIEVESLLPDDLDNLEIRDVAGPIAQLPEDRKRRRSLLLLAGVALCAGLIREWRRRRTRSMVDACSLTPEERALNALDALPDSELERVHGLARILLSYLSETRGDAYSGKTVAELIPLLDEEPELVEMLTTSEQVRFSHVVPDQYLGQLESYLRALLIEPVDPEDGA